MTVLRFSKLLVLVVAIVTTSIVFLNCSLVCVATDSCRKYDICIGNVFDHMFVDGSFKSVSVVCSPVNPSQYPFLYDFGFVNRYTCNTYLDKFNGNSYIFGEFSAAELQNDTSSLSSYCYFTVSLFCAIGDFKGVHSTIDNFILNSSITCGSSTTVITYDSAVEYVTYDGIDIGIYTFGFDLSDVDYIAPDMTVSDMFPLGELLIYPHIYAEASVGDSVDFFLSDLHLKFYSQADVITNGFNDIKDAIDSSNSEVVGKLDDVNSKLDDINDALYSEVDPLPDSIVPGYDEGLDDLQDAYDDLFYVVPAWDDSVFKSMPTGLGDCFSFIGDLFVRINDVTFSGVLFWVLSFGLAVTIIGRAVR